MFNSHISNAEYLVQCAEKHCRTQKYGFSSSSKWKSIHSKLQDAFLEECEREKAVQSKSPIINDLQLINNPLQKLCKSNKFPNRLIVNLFPFDDGYSLMLKTSSTQYAETIQLPYDEAEFLQYIDDEQIPPMLIETLSMMDDDMFHDGCVVAEIRDYRIAACLTNYETKFVLLGPTQQTLLGDVNAITSESSNRFTWENDEKLSLESCLILATSEPLCLAPSPTVQVMKNLVENRKKTLKRGSIKRCIRRHRMNAILRRKEHKAQPTPEPLKLFDFLQKSKTKRKNVGQAPTREMRLPKDMVDVWKKSPVELSFPSNGIDVQKYAKIIDPKPQGLSTSDLLEVQHILLRSESQSRDVYSRITIYQRPSDMQYFGKLQSNKYIQTSGENTVHPSSSCRFLLGTEHRANLYILQYQELFAEDGRRPATVVVNRPLQQEKTQYQIPFLHQPWQLEQDKSLYAVGSINNIPVRQWHRLRVNPQSNLLRQRLSSGQQMPGNPLQRSHSSSSQNAAGNHVTQLSSTTPTLNAATLKSEAQSPFVFPVSQSSIDISQSPRQHPHSLVERKTSSDGITLLSTTDGAVYHLPEGTQSGKRSRHGSAQEIFSFPALNVTSGDASTSDPARVTPTALDGKALDAVTSSTLNRGSPLYFQLGRQPTSMGNQNTLQLQGNPASSLASQPVTVQTQNGTATVLRVPVSLNASSTTGGQQIAINLIGNSRANPPQLVSNIQQIQLTPSTRIQGQSVKIESNQIPADFAMQLAAAANQLNQDKNSPASSNVQPLASSTSAPITFVANNNSIVGSIQPQQLRATVSGQAQQSQQYIRSGDPISQSATITYNPRTQRLTANVPGSNLQQPVQLVQVGGSSSIQQLPIRIPAQQLVQNPARTTTSDNTQLTLTQQLQLKRNRKRKATVDHSK